jgi:hypothetical protein
MNVSIKASVVGRAIGIFIFSRRIRRGNGRYPRIIRVRKPQMQDAATETGADALAKVTGENLNECELN